MSDPPRSMLAPYLRVCDAERALGFYARVFGAIESVRLTTASGKVAHAELRIGEQLLCLADADFTAAARAPEAAVAPVFLYLLLPEIDSVFERAVAAGARVHRPVVTRAYGVRNATLIDPFGHVWLLSTPRS